MKNCVHPIAKITTTSGRTGDVRLRPLSRLDNLLPESCSCINENGSPNAINSNGLSIENIASRSIKLYPNPVKNTLYIAGNSESYDIQVYSLLGQLVIAASNVNEIDVSLFNEGIYLIKISTGSSTITKRFIEF